MGELLFNVKTLLFALFANAFIAIGVVTFAGVSFDHPFDFENLDASFTIDSTTDYANATTADNVIYLGSGASVPSECSGAGKSSVHCLSALSKLPGVFYNGQKRNEKR